MCVDVFMVCCMLCIMFALSMYFLCVYVFAVYVIVVCVCLCSVCVCLLFLCVFLYEKGEKARGRIKEKKRMGGGWQIRAYRDSLVSKD